MEPEESSAGSELRVEIFGGPRVLRGGEPVRLTEYQTALLGLVWANGEGGISRPEVIWLLYEEADGAPQRQRISQFLYGLKKRAGVALILSEGDRLVRGDVESDLNEVEQRTGSAVESDPLGSIECPTKSDSFKNWLGQRKSALLDLAIEHNSLLLSKKGREPIAKAQIARALLRMDPLNERVLRALLRAEAIGHGPLSAEAAFKSHETRVQKLAPGWQAEQKTLDLLRRIESVRESNDTRSTKTNPFVGREKVLANVQEYLESDLAWLVVSVSGEPGIGKSRLLEELSKRLEFDDWQVLRITCRRGSSESPFNLVSRILNRGHPEYWQLFDKDETYRSPEAVMAARPQLVQETLLQFIRSFNRDLVLLIDDAEHADPSSLLSLGIVGSRLCGSKVRVICTRVHPQPWNSRTTYLEDFIDVHRSFELERLSEDAARTLLAFEAQETDPVVIRRAAGNPLFLLELATHESGVGEKIPASLKALLEARFSGLPQQVQALLKVLSAQDDPVSLDILWRIGELGTVDFMQCINMARQGGLVGLGDRNVQFQHELMRLVIYDMMSGAEKAFVHQRFAVELKSAKTEPSPTLILHLERAGRYDEALEVALRLSRDAEEKQAFPEAAALLSAAARNASEPEDLYSINRRLADLLTYLGDPQATVACLEAAIDNAPANGGWPARAELLIDLARAEAESGKVTLDEALEKLACVRSEALGEDSPEVFFRAANAGMILAISGLKLELAQRIFEEVRLREESLSNCESSFWYHLVQSFHVIFGEPPLAIPRLVYAKRIAANSKEEATILLRETVCLVWQGAMDERVADELLHRADTLYAKTGDLRTLFFAHDNIVTWWIDTYQFPRAEVMLERSREIAVELREPGLLASYYCNLGELRVLQDRLEEAAAAFSQVEDRSTPSRVEVTEAVAAGLGLAALEEGKLSLALERAKDLLPLSTWATYPIVDPTLSALLRLRLASITRSGMNAVLEQLTVLRHTLRKRHVPAFLKLSLLECRARFRLKDPVGVVLTDEAMKVTRRLGLVEIERRLEHCRRRSTEHRP